MVLQNGRCGNSCYDDASLLKAEKSGSETDGLLKSPCKEGALDVGQYSRDRRQRSQPPQYPIGFIGAGSSDDTDIRHSCLGTDWFSTSLIVWAQTEHSHDHGR
jgi:hypothetical protein